jgi:dihydropteroate synthase
MRQVKIMGILNATPDSFYEGSRIHVGKAFDAAAMMLQEGAHILDIGGQSTRPGAVPVSASEEIDRVLPVIENVLQHFPATSISVDTYYASVAKAAVEAGATIVNDISAGDDDPEMLPFIAKAGVTYIAMHKRGIPVNMQENPAYTDVVKEITAYFSNKSVLFQNLGINDWILDPGFGFGKTQAHNFQILRQLKEFGIFNKPILIGISRKSMIWKTLNSSPEEALNGTTALHMAGLIRGADLLRVHDVKAASECLTLYLSMENS